MFDSLLYQSRYFKNLLRDDDRYVLFSFTIADYLIDSIDSSAEPCEDFYQFACGTWLKNNRIPDDGRSNDLVFVNFIYFAAIYR